MLIITLSLGSFSSVWMENLMTKTKIKNLNFEGTENGKKNTRTKFTSEVYYKDQKFI